MLVDVLLHLSRAATKFFPRGPFNASDFPARFHTPGLHVPRVALHIAEFVAEFPRQSKFKFGLQLCLLADNASDQLSIGQLLLEMFGQRAVSQLMEWPTNIDTARSATIPTHLPSESNLQIQK